MDANNVTYEGRPLRDVPTSELVSCVNNGIEITSSDGESMSYALEMCLLRIKVELTIRNMS